MVFSLLVTHLNFTVRVDWPFSRSTYCWRRVETISKGEQIAQKMFVNVPVRDLRKSMNFFGKLGFTFNAQFTDETAACMTISEDIYVMLLTETKFKTFTPKQICDATKSTEVFVCLSSTQAGMKSTKWSGRRSPLGEQPTRNRKTTASCTV